ncbi:sigma factor-like helix-turn-helix DNA-binding protein [Chungangia koreensis]|uniref:Sigma factor-like helix-turn-helix DNA-binding protein n=1 Tax=Chungangia koreensis TaxID=752657 RepID=A0ABV8X112_9LACT
MKLDEEISALEFEIKNHQLDLTRWQEGGDLFKQNSIDVVKRNQQIVEESIKFLKKILAGKREFKEGLLERINHFKGLDNQILRMKYIEGKTLEQIATELNFSLSHISKRHAELTRMDRIAEGFLEEIKRKRRA